jgi:hypothetical protein
MSRPTPLALVLALLLGLAEPPAAAGAAAPTGSDPVLDGDPVDPVTGRAAVIVPGTPWVRRGADGVLGTADDVIDPSVIGDVDLVVRVGRVDPSGPLPPPLAEAAVGRVEPFGGGTPLTVSVLLTDGGPPAPGRVVAPFYLEGLPILVLAFPDLDGDGFVGITHLDGDTRDALVEERELEPVGMRYLTARGGVASGELHVTVGGPPDAPLRVALTAAAYAGPLHEEYFHSLIPDGPAITTRLPFLPQTDPVAAIQQGLFGLLPATQGGRIAVLVQRALTPDPGHPLLGEAFTLRLDGSDPTFDVAQVLSGSFSLPAPLVPARGAEPSYRIRPSRVGPLVAPAWLFMLDDGPETHLVTRIAGLDRLGNVTSPEEGARVRVRTRGPLAILEPDLDGDPHREELWLEGPSGAELVLDDEGGAFDGEDHGWLVLDAPGRPSRVKVLLVDPDLDDDGLVTDADVAPVLACSGFGRGDDRFNMHLDLDGDGVVGALDAAWVLAHLGETASADVHPPGEKIKIRKWSPGKAKKPNGVRRFKDLREEHDEPDPEKAKGIQKVYCPVP